MYTVEDETFERARFILSTLAREISGQHKSGIRRPVDLHELVRRSAQTHLPEDGEADYLNSIADRLERSYPIDQLFPRRRRSDKA
jgi:predicted Ser/Thr protein kinase